MSLNFDLVTSDDLRALQLDQLVQDVADKESVYYGLALNPLLQEGKWSPAQLEALRFISAVLTMNLRPDTPTDPYGPMFEMGGRRGAIPSDFPKDFLSRIKDWVLELADPEIRARFLDLLWVGAKDYTAAKGAVSAYIEAAKRLESPDDWNAYAVRMERALRLAASLGKGALDLKGEVLGELYSCASRYGGRDPLYLTSRVIQLLLEFRHGDPNVLAGIALVAAEGAESAGDYWRAKEYHARVAECHSAAGDEESKAAALRREAESLVLEAEAALLQPHRGAITAVAILSQAVDAMRQAPGGKERAEALHERLLELQPKAVDEMKPMSVSRDTTELVQQAIAAVRDKDFKEAVWTLCRLANAPKMADLTEHVFEEARSAPLQAHVSGDIVNARGRVVAKAPPLGNTRDSSEPGLRVRMFRAAARSRSLRVQAILNPARIEICAAHNPSREDVLALIRHSPWIPPGHHESVCRGLVAGFHGDMIVASHLVPIQLEALVRHVVERAGGTTTVFDSQGLQPEKSLNTLLETPEVRAVFGEDAVFEMQDVLTDQLGSNLRNEVAHGLRGDDRLFELEALYAWWMLLRYCVFSAVLAQRKSAVQDAGPVASSGEAEASGAGLRETDTGKGPVL